MPTTQPTLSICIATFNRASFLATTLESIIAQATNDCEIVISDNASTDNTERVVAEFACRFARLRYFKQDTNKGIDRNFDRAVELATGTYCWPMPDDDELKPGAVTRVIQAIGSEASLIIVNVEFMDFTLSRVIRRGVTFESDRIYDTEELDRLFNDAVNLNGYIGSFVIRREIWMARDRQRYFGCDFIHMGVIYQQQLPGKALLIAQPLVAMRMGNSHAWWPRQFDICMSWPSLVSSFALSESAKNKYCRTAPWKDLRVLLWFRALGVYSLREYRKYVHPQLRWVGEMLAPAFVALLPVTLVRTAYALFLRVTRSSMTGSSPDWELQILHESRFQKQSRAAPTQPQGTANRGTN